MPITPLSQAHLTLLDTCDRKYQYVFFDALSAPATYDQQLTTQWGSQFHLLMQQRSLDLPVAAIADAYTDMAASMAALAIAAPEVFQNSSGPSIDSEDSTDSEDPEGSKPFRSKPFRQSEHRRTLAFNNYLLTVIYDQLVLTPDQGQIFDWKTHQKPPKKAWLQKDWQTRLYLYVLCETTELRPEQISMTYWFVRLGDQGRSQPSSEQFGYSLVQHQRTEQDLQALTSRLTRMSERLEFPKVPVGSEQCKQCVFNVRCDRAPDKPSRFDSARMLREASDISLESVEEIPL